MRECVELRLRLVPVLEMEKLLLDDDEDRSSATQTVNTVSARFDVEMRSSLPTHAVYMEEQNHFVTDGIFNGAAIVSRDPKFVL